MYNIGIDLGGTRVKMGLLRDGELIARETIGVNSVQGLLPCLPLIDEAIARLMDENNVSEVQGIGMAFPGIVDPRDGKVLSTNEKYDDAPALDLGSHYKEKYNAAFFIENDARMVAVGEWQFGAGAGCDDLVMVTIGTGIGTAVISEGKLLRGKHFQAGILGGHFVVNNNGKRCSCGNNGCVEAEAATWNLESLIKGHKDVKTSSLAGDNRVDFYQLFKAVGEQDRVAVDIKNHCLDIWAAGIITCIHAYDPEMIILGGGIMNSSAEIIPYIENKIKTCAWTPWGDVTVKVSSLMDDAGILGVTHSLNNNPNFKESNEKKI